METNHRLMLMIDGDNAQASLLPQILAEVSKYGVMKIRRVYGNWDSPQLKSWKDLLHTYALKPEQQYSYTSGKNATDIALIIDAMDFIHGTGVDGICIVSSDSDYTPLATRIREKNLFVMGIGKSNTPRAFVNACDVFVYTENLVDDDATPALPNATQIHDSADSVVTEEASDLNRLKGLLQTAFESAVQEDGWAHLGTLGSTLKQLDPAFDSRTYGFKLLSRLIIWLAEEFPDFIQWNKRQTKKGDEAIYIRIRETV